MKVPSFFSLFCVVLLFSLPVSAHPNSRNIHLAPTFVGLENSTVLIIRHAEKSHISHGLSIAGAHRANAYVNYFENFHVNGETLKLSALYAAADTDDNQRPRLTLEPLSLVTGMAVEQPFSYKDVKKMADWLRAAPSGRNILIAWHHSEIPALIHELGGDPQALLPGGLWPADSYDLVIVLKYDAAGAIIPSACHLIREPSPLK